MQRGRDGEFKQRWEMKRISGLMICAFAPLCELHSAEADVFASKGSGGEEDNRWI